MACTNHDGVPCSGLRAREDVAGVLPGASREDAGLIPQRGPQILDHPPSGIRPRQPAHGRVLAGKDLGPAGRSVGACCGVTAGGGSGRRETGAGRPSDRSAARPPPGRKPAQASLLGGVPPRQRVPVPDERVSGVPVRAPTTDEGVVPRPRIRLDEGTSGPSGGFSPGRGSPRSLDARAWRYDEALGAMVRGDGADVADGGRPRSEQRRLRPAPSQRPARSARTRNKRMKGPGVPRWDPRGPKRRDDAPRDKDSGAGSDERDSCSAGMFLWPDRAPGTDGLGWPTTDADMPLLRRPSRLDWGETGRAAAFHLLRSSPPVAPAEPWLREPNAADLRPVDRGALYNRNVRYLYRTVLEGTPTSVSPSGDVEWDVAPRLVQRQEIPHCLDGVELIPGPGMAHVAVGDEDHVVMPLGLMGGDGLLVGRYRSDGIWLGWLAINSAGVLLGLQSWTGGTRNTTIVANSDFLFLGRGGKIAVYKTPNSAIAAPTPPGSYDFLGHIDLPTWNSKRLDATDLAISNDGILAASVIPLAEDDDPDEPSMLYPRALVYDVAVQEAVVDFSSSPLLAVVALPLMRPPGGAAATARPAWSLAIGPLPSPLVSDRSAFSASRRAWVLAIKSGFGVEVVDISPSAIDRASTASIPGLDVAAGVPIIRESLDNFGISEAPDPCGKSDYGPPRYALTAGRRHNLMEISPNFSPSGVDFAGELLSVHGVIGGRYQGLFLLALDFSTTTRASAPRLRLRCIGFAQPELGVSRQYEGHIHSFYDAETRHLVGSWRAQWGPTGYRMPAPPTVATALAQVRQTWSGGACAAVPDPLWSGSFYPADAPFYAGPACSPDGYTPALPSSSTYLTPLEQVHDSTATPWVNPCPPLVAPPLPCGVGTRGLVDGPPPRLQLPTSRAAEFALEAFTAGAATQPWLNRGFGHETMGGAILPPLDSSEPEILFLTDRATFALLAFDTTSDQGLAVTGWTRTDNFAPGTTTPSRIVNCSDAEVLPWGPEHALVLVCGWGNHVLHFLRWTRGAQALEEVGRLQLCSSVWADGPFQGLRRSTLRPSQGAYNMTIAARPGEEPAPVLVAALSLGPYDFAVVDLGDLPGPLDPLWPPTGVPGSPNANPPPTDLVDIPRQSGPAQLQANSSPRGAGFFQFQAEEGSGHTLFTDNLGMTWRARLQARDVASHGRYVYAWVEEAPLENHPRVAVNPTMSDGTVIDPSTVGHFWLAVLELVPPKDSLPPGLEWKELDRVSAVDDGLLPGVRLRLVTMVNLNTSSPDTPGEGARVYASPNGRYVVACGTDNVGTWVVDAGSAAEEGDFEPEQGTWQVVAGLNKRAYDDVGILWELWNPTAGPIELGGPMGPPRLTRYEVVSTDDEATDWPPATAEERIDRYPTWPLIGQPEEDAALDIDLPRDVASFAEQDGQTFLFVGTRPITAWKLDPSTPSGNPLVYIGALCGSAGYGAWRGAVVGSTHAWFIGEGGCHAIPLLCPWEPGCCPPSGPTFHGDPRAGDLQ
jgi:hypothetical protein